MYELILNFLKTKLPGVQKTYLETIAKQFEGKIEDKEKIADTITDTVIDALKISAQYAQTEGDTRVTDGIKSWREKHNLDENGVPVKKEEPEKEPPADDIDTKIAAAFEKHLKPITDQLNGFKMANEKAGKQERLNSLLKEKKLPETAAKFINLDSETTIEDQVNDLAGFYSSVEADTTKKLAGEGYKPKKVDDDGTPSVDEYKKIMGATNNDSSKVEKLDLTSKEDV